MTAKEELRRIVDSLTEAQANYVLEKCRELVEARKHRLWTPDECAAFGRVLAEAASGRVA